MVNIVVVLASIPRNKILSFIATHLKYVYQFHLVKGEFFIKVNCYWTDFNHIWIFLPKWHENFCWNQLFRLSNWLRMKSCTFEKTEKSENPGQMCHFQVIWCLLNQLCWKRSLRFFHRFIRKFRPQWNLILGGVMPQCMYTIFPLLFVVIFYKKHNNTTNNSTQGVLTILVIVGK